MENKIETPLQRLIAIIKKKGFELAEENRDTECWLLAEIQVEAEDLLPYEREVIENAVRFDPCIPTTPFTLESAQHYINQTFQTNE